MTVKTWICNICGDPYIGEDKPTHCPFCGAPSKHIKLGTEYQEPVIENLTETSRNNILEAIKLEVANSQFYFCASTKAKTLELKKRFKALGKVEAEHASLLAKMINAQKASIDRNTTECPAEESVQIKEAHAREVGAVEHYKKFAEQATEPRVKEVFNVLVEIETTHIELADNS